jgi:hypothetical protein
MTQVVQVGQGPDGGTKKRIVLDQGLLTTLSGRWHSETHTFYL